MFYKRTAGYRIFSAPHHSKDAVHVASIIIYPYLSKGQGTLHLNTSPIILYRGWKYRQSNSIDSWGLLNFSYNLLNNPQQSTIPSYRTMIHNYFSIGKTTYTLVHFTFANAADVRTRPVWHSVDTAMFRMIYHPTEFIYFRTTTFKLSDIFLYI